MSLPSLPLFNRDSGTIAERFFEIADHLQEGVYFLDPQRTIRYWNKAAEQITGYRAEEVVGRSCLDNLLLHTDAEGVSLCLSGCPSLKAQQSGRTIDARIFVLHKSGYRIPIELRIVPVLDAACRPAGAFEIFTDRVDAESLRQELARLAGVAATDFLTGLPNRRALEEQIDVAFYSLERHDHPFALILADVDHFKVFNDRHGHAVGDKVLINVANSLHAALRHEDSGARWGGEEFAILVRHVNDKAILLAIMERVRRVVCSAHLPHDRQPLSVTISLGGTPARREDNLHSLLARADAMLYRSKAEGRNCSRVG